MLTQNPEKHRALPRTTTPTMLVVTLALCSSLWGGVEAASEPLYPTALLNWMVEGTFHTLIADKSQQRLMVWKIKDGEPTLVESFRCATGENEGDKWVRGDMRTPEGVYFFCSVIDGRSLPAKYGLWAFTTDYPNFVDRRRGKSGDGIWLHGRDKPLGPRPDSNGCIAVENQDLIKISRYVRLQSTPLIVVEKLQMAPRYLIMQQERELRDFIEGWRQAWESRDLEAYMERYSPNFQNAWLDYRAWKEKKRKLLERYKKIRVRLGTPYLYRQNGMVTSIFTQEFRSEAYGSSGIKVIYIVRDPKYRIYAEDYHKPVDDPFPAAPLLARVGADPGMMESAKELNIRLVSTDEPDQSPVGELETPRPSAPSRAVVVEKTQISKEIPTPAIAVNEKSASGKSSERLVVARLVTAYTPAQPELRPRSSLHCAVGAVESGPTSGQGGRQQAIASEKPDGDRDVRSSQKRTPRSERKGEQAAEKLTGNSAAEGVVEHSAEDKDRENNGDREGVLKFLSKWRQAWERKDLDTYVKMYHLGFQSGTTDYQAFLKSKEKFFRKYGTIRVRTEQVRIERAGDRLVVKFLQHFRGDDYRDKGWKSMVLAGGKDKGFQIVSEDWSSF